MDKLTQTFWLAYSAAALACNNPVPAVELSDAGAIATFGQHARVCELPTTLDGDPSTPGEAALERTRGLFTASEPTAYTERTLPCAGHLAGSYALHVALDVFMQEPGPLRADRDPGRGQLEVLLRAEVRTGTTTSTADVELQVCGLGLPPTYGYASSEVTQLRIADEAWESARMPHFSSRVRRASEQDAQTLEFQAFAVLLGIALREPDAMWPSFEQTPHFACDAQRAGERCFDDYDNDGAPGISLEAQRDGEVEDAPYPACGDWHFAAPSTAHEPGLPDGAASVARLFVGMRTALQLVLTLDERCSLGSGTAAAEDLVTRVLDCDLEDGARCSAVQATNLDARAPHFHVLARGETPPEYFRDSRIFIDETLDRRPSEGGRVYARRLPDDAPNGCAPVRAIEDFSEALRAQRRP